MLSVMMEIIVQVKTKTPMPSQSAVVWIKGATTINCQKKTTIKQVKIVAKIPPITPLYKATSMTVG
jgi:hypothetical protein